VSPQGGEDAEVQSHPNRELEMAHDVDQLARRVMAPQDFRALGFLHVRDHGMAMLNVSLLQWHEDDICVVAFDNEIGRVREQGVVLVRIDVRRGWAWLSHGEPNQTS
jgi:hypothetical protein